MLEIEPGLVACKTSTLPAVLLHWPCTRSSDGVILLVCSGQCPVGLIMHEDPPHCYSPHINHTHSLHRLAEFKPGGVVGKVSVLQEP